MILDSAVISCCEGRGKHVERSSCASTRRIGRKASELPPDRLMGELTGASVRSVEVAIDNNNL